MSAEPGCSRNVEPVGDDDVIAVGHSLGNFAIDVVAAPSSVAGGDAVVENSIIGVQKRGRESSSFWELCIKDGNLHQPRFGSVAGGITLRGHTE
jgi:hypothetical protein